MRPSEAARAATPRTAVNVPQEIAHSGKPRDLLGVTSRPGPHSRSENHPTLAPPDTWDSLGTVLQRLLVKWEEANPRG